MAETVVKFGDKYTKLISLRWIPEDGFQAEDWRICWCNGMLFFGRISNEVLLPKGWTELEDDKVNSSEAAITEEVTGLY